MTRRFALVTLAATAALLTGLVGGRPADAASPGANGKIVWVGSDRDTDHGIWVMNADGSGKTRLLGQADDFSPVWSPDGRKIAFSRAGTFPSGCPYGEIYVMNADGSGLTAITGGSSAAEDDPTWSPDGQKIAYTRHSHDEQCHRTDWGIWAMNADGSGQTQLTSGGTTTLDMQPAWSPEGHKIAFTRSDATSLDEIYTMNADGSQVTRLTDWKIPNGATASSAPAWSPDGQKIAYMRIDFTSTYEEIWVMNADGSGQAAVTQNDFVGNSYPAWSPDGQKILFSGLARFCEGCNNEIFSINADGSGQTQLTDNKVLDWMPDWQPLEGVDPQGTVVVNLDAVPDDAQDFGFDLPQPFSLDDDADSTLPSSRQFQLAAGTQTVRLTGVEGWPVTGVSCVDPDGGTTTSVVTGSASVDLDAGETVTCTFTTTKGTVAAPRANGKITWVRPTELSGHGTWDVWTMNPDGTGATNLLPAGVDEEHPAWSPDGRQIAFDRSHGTPSGCGVGNIYVMDADGSNVTQLTTNSLGTVATEPTWSPDGARIAYTLAQQDPTCNNGDSEIWVMNADGSGQHAITSGGPEIGNSDGEPDWSPDGTRIAFTGHRGPSGNRPLGIFTINPDGSQITRLTGVPISFIRTTAPAWSPDGQRIAYEQIDAWDGSYEIWTMNADGTGHAAVTANGFLSNMSPAWSPDGRQIAFSGQDDQVTFDNEIFVINIDGTGQTAITNDTIGDSFPDWQPVPAVEDPPTLTDTDPDSPANDNEPRVKGTAPGAATVALYSSPDCSGTPAAEGTAAAFASPGLPVTVPDNSSTTFRATATSATGDVSACSSSSITYVEETPPPPPDPRGTIQIVLDSGDAQDFDFNGSGPGSLEFFTLDDDGLADFTHNNQRTFLDATTGPWSMQQELLPGWELTAITCTDPDGGSSSNLLTGTALIDLDADEQIVCTFTNRRPPPPPTGTIEIRLNSGESQNFEFTGVGPSTLDFFTLDDDTDPTLSNEHAIVNADAGAWSFSQQLLPGWNLTAITCTDPDAGTTTDLLNGTALIDLDADEQIVCTFTNRRPPPPPTGLIEIRLDSGSAQDFQFSGFGPSTLEFFTLDDDNDPTFTNERVIINADVGQWGISQALLVGWNLTAITCTDPDGGSSSNLLTGTALIDLDADEQVVCTFTNRRPPPPPTGTIQINLDGGDGFDFQFTGVGPSTLEFFTLDDDNATDSTHDDQRTIIAAPAGAWSFSQQLLPGWNLTAITCTDPDGGTSSNLLTGTAQIDLDADEFVSCTFTNRDTTPPALSLPASFTVDATGPAGARVTYVTTASDAVDPSPTLTCSPLSGSLLSIGATGVSCSATDAAGNVALGSFIVTVRGAAEQLERLVEKTLRVVRQPARARALASRLLAAADLLATGRTVRACSTLNTYLEGVDGLPVPLATPLDRAELLADGARIRAVMGC